jgi:hypothetical protein
MHSANDRFVLRSRLSVLIRAALAPSVISEELYVTAQVKLHAQLGKHRRLQRQGLIRISV